MLGGYRSDEGKNFVRTGFFQRFGTFIQCGHTRGNIINQADITFLERMALAGREGTCNIAAAFCMGKIKLPLCISDSGKIGADFSRWMRQSFANQQRLVISSHKLPAPMQRDGYKKIYLTCEIAPL